MVPPKRPWLQALRVALVVTALILFAQVFRTADTHTIARLLFGVGASGLLLLMLPQLAALALETLGWVLTFRAGGTPVRFAPLLREPASTSAAFVVMKRGKELFWIAVGYALLGSDLGALLRGRLASNQRNLRLRPARA